ncbi:MAG: hypothetical protein VX951_09450 [Planctomycetota bacterium]|nr:hypothetical protein [Planctomycetota bacterium]
MKVSSFLIALLTLFLASHPAAQIDLKAIQKNIVPVQLATKTDDKGLQQWDEYHQNCPACKTKKILECGNCKHLEEPKLCPECKTTRKAPCHYCAGTGKLADPLKIAPCPGCQGHSVFICHMCANTGRIKIAGGGKKGVKCNVCKGNGGRACTVCSGNRQIQSLFKGKVGSTDLKKLRKTRSAIDKLIKDVVKFSAVGQSRIDRKKFAALFKKAKPHLPMTKKFLAQVDQLSKALDQPRFKGNDRTQMASMDRVRRYLLHYLLHQNQVLDACIKRAEFNAQAVKPGK